MEESTAPVVEAAAPTESEQDILRRLHSNDPVQQLRQVQTRAHFGADLVRALLRSLEVEQELCAHGQLEDVAPRAMPSSDRLQLVLPLPLKLCLGNALQEYIRTYWHDSVTPVEEKQAIREGLLDAIFVPFSTAMAPRNGGRQGASLWRTVLYDCIQRAWANDSHLPVPCKTFLDRVVATIISASSSTRTGRIGEECTSGQAKGKEKAHAPDSDISQQPALGESEPDDLLEQALLVLYRLCKHFQYRTDSYTVKDDIVKDVLPIMLRLFTRLMSGDKGQLERSATNLLYLLKAYWALSRVGESIAELSAEDQTQWNDQIFALVNTTLPFEKWDVCPAEPDLSPTQVDWWKCKRYGWVVLTRLMNRRARKQLHRLKTPDERMQALTNTCLRCLHNYCTKQFKLTERILVSLIAFLLNCLAPKDTRAMMLEGQAEQLIDDLVCMCHLSPEQLRLFYEQPIDYLRQEYDLDNMFSNAGSVAKNLLTDVLHNDAIFDKILARIERGLTSDSVVEKDAALSILGYIYFKENTCASGARLLTEHVLPIARDQKADVLLRSRACYAIHGVSRVLLGLFAPTLVTEATEAMLACMRDDSIVVRFHAAMAFSQLASETLEHSSSMILNSFSWILETIIKLVEDVGNDELIPALNSLIFCMSLQQMSAYAAILCKHLIDAFDRVAGHAQDDDNSAMLAVGCLGALSGLLDSLFGMKAKEQDSVELQQQIDAVSALLVPWLLKLFTGPALNIMEFVEELMRVLSYLTFHLVPTPADLFSLFGPLCHLLTDQYALTDWLDELSMPLSNFIANGTALFVSDKENINHYYRACSLAINANVDLNNAENVRAYCRMVGELFEHCKEYPGSIDDEVERFLELVMSQLPAIHPVETKGNILVWILSVVAHALYYNPVITVQCLARHQRLDAVFSLFYDHSDLVFSRFMKSSMLKKVFVAGFCCLLSTVQESTPPEVTRSLLPFLLKLLAQHQEHSARLALKRKRGREDSFEQETESNDDDDDEDNDENDNDEERRIEEGEQEEAEQEEEEAGISSKRKREDNSSDDPSSSKKKRNEDWWILNESDVREESEEFYSFDSIEDADCVEEVLNRMLPPAGSGPDLLPDAPGIVESPTPMTTVDVFAIFYTAVQELQTRDLHTYHLLSAVLDNEEQRLMDGFLQLGAERRQGIKSLKQMCVQAICSSPTLYAKAEQEAECLPATVWSDVQAYRQVTSQQAQRKGGKLLSPRGKSRARGRAHRHRLHEF